jgi:hypothetical protein
MDIRFWEKYQKSLNNYYFLINIQYYKLVVDFIIWGSKITL